MDVSEGETTTSCKTGESNGATYGWTASKHEELCFASSYLAFTKKKSSDARECVDGPLDGQGMDLFYLLPNELMVHWMSFLELEDLFTAGLVCRRWRCLSMYYWKQQKFSLTDGSKHIPYILFRDNQELNETKLLEMVMPLVKSMGNQQTLRWVFFFLKYCPPLDELIWSVFQKVDWKDTDSIQLLCDLVLKFVNNIPPVGVCSIMDQSYTQIFRVLALMKLHLNKNIIYCSPLDKDVEVLLRFFNKLSETGGLLGLTAKSVLQDLSCRTNEGRKVSFIESSIFQKLTPPTKQVGNLAVRNIVQSSDWVVDITTVPQRARWNRLQYIHSIFINS